MLFSYQLSPGTDYCGYVPGPALVKVLYQTAVVPFCIIPGSLSQSVCVSDIAFWPFKMKATDYLQLHKQLIVEHVT